MKQDFLPQVLTVEESLHVYTHQNPCTNFFDLALFINKKLVITQMCIKI